MLLSRGGSSGCFSAIALACLLFYSSDASAVQNNPERPPQAAIAPEELVRQAVLNEIADAEHPLGAFRYSLRKESTSGTTVRDMVEVKDGFVARVLTWNGQPLTPEERRKDDERLEHLAGDPAEQQKKFEQQKQEQRRVLSIVRALPSAAIYSDDGTEMVRGRLATRLKFRPNPHFEPTTRETYAFKTSEGHLWIDQAAKRIVRLEATLTEDINLGWGLLGHIEKGGTLMLEQTAISKTAWRLTTLNIQATGTALLFKSINIRQRQSAFDYREVPLALSVAEAVQLLRRAPSKAVSGGR